MMVIITCSSFGIFINTFYINIHFITFEDKTHVKHEPMSTLDISLICHVLRQLLTWRCLIYTGNRKQQGCEYIKPEYKGIYPCRTGFLNSF